MMVFAGVNARAEEKVEGLDIGDVLDKIPFKQGVAYSFQDSEISYLSTIEIAQWRDFNFEAGYSSTDKIVGVISYDMLKLQDYGVDLPILKLVDFNLGLYAGFGRLGITEGNNEVDYGASLTIISVKF